MYQLFYAPGACSLAPHIILIECGFKYELVKVNLKTKKTQAGEDYLAINPKGSVPALKTPEGIVLTEVAVILQYLADQKPELRLLPEFKTTERYQALIWLNYVSTEIHKGFTPLFSADRTMKTDSAKEELKEVSRELLSIKFDYLSKELKERQSLLSSGTSVADFYLFNVLNWGQFVGLKLTNWPVLDQYFQSILKRASVQGALRAEGIIRD
jgi:glutathione S-transferase